MHENIERPPRRSRAETKEATRQALLVAGLAELVEHGLDVPSLDAICARAGYTRGAFYVHFKDREDFFVAVMDWALSGILASVMGANGDGDLASAIARFNHYMTNREWPVVGKYAVATHRLMEAISRSEQLKTRFAEVLGNVVVSLSVLIKRAQSKGEVRPGLDPKHTAELIVTLGMGALSLQDTGITFPEDQMRSTLMAILGA